MENNNLVETSEVVTEGQGEQASEEDDNQWSTCAKCGKAEKEEKFSEQILYGVTPGVSLDVNGSISELIKEEEFENFWIQCDICTLWYHGSCVEVEEYEEALIDQYHCPTCSQQEGPSKMKKMKLAHRRDFDDITQFDRPTQIGTKKFSDDLKTFIDPAIPECPENVIKTYEDGFAFLREFNEQKEWKNPCKVKNRDGLGLKLPDSDFDVDQCVEMIGKDYVIDTIDVYKQHSYNMSLGRFRDKFKVAPEFRERLYNILSLEFTETKLNDLVSPPELVKKLSWVYRFWPDMPLGNNGTSAHLISLLGISPSYEISSEHIHSKPKVSMFCLMGMQDSFTDFHIDFGGSSVWYHVFSGKKVFYVVEPTELNLDLFHNYQSNPKGTETFFGDVVKEAGSSIYKISVEEGETVFIPSGWIHAVWTPEDSMVFGGNFIHDLNVEMQLKIYEFEEANNIDVKFMFPSFELTNWYAAQQLLNTLKEHNEEGERAPGYIIEGLKAMQISLQKWMNRDKTNKKLTTHITFNNLLPQIKTELGKQVKIAQMGTSRKLTKRTRSSNDLTLSAPKQAKKDISKSFDGSVPNSPKRGRGRPPKFPQIKLKLSASEGSMEVGMPRNSFAEMNLKNVEVFIPFSDQPRKEVTEEKVEKTDIPVEVLNTEEIEKVVTEQMDFEHLEQMDFEQTEMLMEISAPEKKLEHLSMTEQPQIERNEQFVAPTESITEEPSTNKNLHEDVPFEEDFDDLESPPESLKGEQTLDVQVVSIPTLENSEIMEENSIKTIEEEPEKLTLTIKISRSISGESNSARVISDPEEVALLTPRSIDDYKPEIKPPKSFKKVDGIDLTTMFKPRSSSGRKVRPASWVANAVQIEDEEEEDSKSKKFMDQFTKEERQRIEMIEKVGLKEDRDYQDYEDYIAKTRSSPKKRCKSTSLSNNNKKIAPVAALKTPKAKGSTVKQRLANKLKIRL
uniref:JmjC domain-containing protein n=1 Tax=Acrobeloides nanus TaxID=290746 RepID=A0A914C5T2_9BILA